MENTTVLQNDDSCSGDFKNLLQQTLIARCKINPSYSLRAFAKQLNIEPSFLSKLISGKRRPTAAVIKKFALALGMNPVETENYLKGAGKKVISEKETLSFQNLALDHFAVISDWYHYAILELIHVEGFKSDASWIAKKLGINNIQAKDALERLVRLEMIRKDESVKYINSSGNNTPLTTSLLR